MDVNVAMLNEEMTKKGWTISDLAAKSSVDKSTISRLLDGRCCSVSTAQKLVKALGISSRKAGVIFFGDLVALLQQ